MKTGVSPQAANLPFLLASADYEVIAKSFFVVSSCRRVVVSSWCTSFFLGGNKGRKRNLGGRKRLYRFLAWSNGWLSGGLSVTLGERVSCQFSPGLGGHRGQPIALEAPKRYNRANKRDSWLRAFVFGNGGQLQASLHGKVVGF